MDDSCREVTISGYNAWKVVLHYAGSRLKIVSSSLLLLDRALPGCEMTDPCNMADTVLRSFCVADSGGCTGHVLWREASSQGGVSTSWCVQHACTDLRSPLCNIYTHAKLSP